MKTLYTLIIAVAMCSMAYTQSSPYSLTMPLANPAKAANPMPVNTNRIDPAHSRDARAVIYSEDFSTWPPVGWTIHSGAASTITNPALQAYHDGGGNAEIQYVNSVDRHDEWLISPDWFIPPIGPMRLRFDWFSSYYWHVSPNDNVDIKIKLVTGGGATTSGAFAASTVLWEEGDAGLVAAAGNPFPWTTFTWYTGIIDLTSYQGQTINLAFHYDGTDGAQHAWDNISVEDVPVNSLIVKNVYHHDHVNDWYYSKTPLEEVQDMVFGMNLRNDGAADQPNTFFTMEVSGPETYSGSSASILHPAGKDSIRFHNTGWSPGTLGDYEVAFVAYSDSTEIDSLDNYDTTSFNISDVYFAKGRDTWLGGYYTNDADYNSTPTTVTYGNVFEINGTDANCKGIRTGFTTGTDVGTIVQAELWHWANTAGFQDQGNWNQVTAMDYTIAAGDITSTSGAVVTWVDIIFPTPQPLTIGQTYLVGITVPPSPDSVRIPTAGLDIDNGAVVGGTDLGAASQGANWYGLGSIPQIQMIMLYSGAGIKEDGISDFNLKQNSPNPCRENTTISFELNASMQTSVEITDLTGKSIEVIELGNKNAGMHSVLLNTSELAPGIYNYTLRGGDQATTKSLVVTE